MSDDSKPTTIDDAIAAEREMTIGPWTSDPTNDDIIAPDDAVKHPDGSTGNVVGYLYVDQDWRGVIAIRNAWPALVRERDELREELVRLRAHLNGAAPPHDLEGR